MGCALRRAAPANVEITALDRSELDITNSDDVVRCVAALRPDWIINAAAYTAVDAAESAPQPAFAVNRTGAANLAAAAAEQGARMLQVSTDYVFDGRQGHPYRADDPTAPLNVYGESKRAGEVAVMEQLGDRALVVRTAWLYSEMPGNFFHTISRLLSERERVEVVEDQVGTPTLAADLAALLWEAVDRDLYGLHHWTNAGVASWYDFAVAIAEEMAVRGLAKRLASVVPVSSDRFPRAAARPGYSVLACSLAEAADRWRAPRRHWRTALRALMDQCSNKTIT
ncbi:MAG: dTDP-4-dehydrorhamnose reductase [Gammaproteobacteria bacterium]